MSVRAESHPSPPQSAPTAASNENREHKGGGKLFGRYHKLALPVISSLLSTVLGGVIGAGIQRRESERSHKVAVGRAKQQWLAEQAQAELNKAVTTHERIATLMDRRAHYMRLLLNDYSSKDTPPQKIKTHEEQYRKVFNDWNENLNLNLALINQYFGGELRGRFENEIMPEFARISRLMQKEGERKGSLEQRLDRLRRTIYIFNQDLTKSIQDRRAALNK